MHLLRPLISFKMFCSFKCTSLELFLLNFFPKHFILFDSVVCKSLNKFINLYNLCFGGFRKFTISEVANIFLISYSFIFDFHICISKNLKLTLQKWCEVFFPFPYPHRKQLVSTP